MKTFENKVVRYLVAVTLLGLLATAAGAKAPTAEPFPGTEPDPQLSLAPHPATWDQITHNIGNIATTVDNWGYIGGYSYYDYPSGEWPRNSGHHYLAEVRFWMGGVTAAGDTLVANSADDFQALANPDFTDNEYKILLSTDTARYYDYDPTDTTGLGDGSPAFGWRVWDPQDGQWEYNDVYNSLSSSFSPGGPTSLQDSHVRFGDAALGSPLMGLEVTQTIYQWNYCYNEDFMFVVLDITNTSTEDYADFAVGVYMDIDVGGLDGSGENGRLGDLVAFDSTENLAWIYDEDSYDPGWGPLVTTGLMGTKLLETPDNIGMTAFRTDDWAFLPEEDEGRYAMINSTQFDASLPPTDQFYVQCTRGIDLTAGKTVRVVFALVAGADESDFMNNARLAQELYDNFFVGPQPPPTPKLQVRASDGKVFLQWSDTSEVANDPMSGVNDFVGYKLYRSDDRGKTWGTPIYRTNNNCLDLDYTTLATYTVNTPGDPIPRSFVDTGLYNGFEYWYCLAAFDNGDSALGIDPLQSGFGTAGEVSNVIKVVPSNDPAGYFDAQSTVEHTVVGGVEPSDGTVYAEVFGPDSLLGDDYTVGFFDQPEATYWFLVNETTGDTILSNQTLYNEDPNEYPVAGGVRVVVNDGDHFPTGIGQTGFAGADTTMAVAGFYGPGLPNFQGLEDYIFGNQVYRDDYELRYTGDSSMSGDLASGAGVWIPLEAWNIERNERVTMTLYDVQQDGVWQPYDPIILVDYPYDPSTNPFGAPFPFSYSWMFDLDPATYSPSVGDVLTIEGAPLNGPNDVFTFKPDGINSAAAGNELKDIKVVPNPYFVRYNDGVDPEVVFINVPDECKIRIYTLAGDLVQTIDHDAGTGDAGWDLLSSNRQQVASGIYLYHVESEYGEFLGRFAVVK